MLSSRQNACSLIGLCCFSRGQRMPVRFLVCSFAVQQIFFLHGSPSGRINSAHACRGSGVQNSAAFTRRLPFLNSSPAPGRLLKLIRREYMTSKLLSSHTVCAYLYRIRHCCRGNFEVWFFLCRNVTCGVKELFSVSQDFSNASAWF